jgi:hypothetical protein
VFQAERVHPTFAVLVDADAFNAERGEETAASILAEAMLTVALRSYPRRVLIAAKR